jgi:tetratricopeptide (TPR) repeat protein
VKKQQLILLGSGIILLVLLFFFGNTTPPKKAAPAQMQAAEAAPQLFTETILSQAKQKLTAPQLNRITQLENSVVRGNVKEQQIAVYKQLSHFWGDSMQNRDLGIYYMGETAKLENSEKNLNFAARLLLDDLMTESNPAHANWLATQAKALLDRSLEINPANDSAKIGIGACYMFGNISSNPMQGILAVREIAEKNPDNIYAQMMLAYGGIKSGQYDKAIERLLIVLQKQPANIEAIINLAETYERKGDKQNAIKWYQQAEKLIAVPEAKKELEERIKSLQ